MDLGERRNWGRLDAVEAGETVDGMYCMREETVFNK